MLIQKIDNLKKTINLDKIEQSSIYLLLFSIPFSPAIPNLVGVLLIILFFIRGDFLISWQRLKSQPIFWAFLIYLLIYPVSIFWSDNVEWAGHMSERHLIYLIFPFVLLVAKKENIKFYIFAFLAGVSFTEIVSYLMWFELLSFDGMVGDAGNPTPFYSHVLYNPILSWGIYLLMYRLLFEKTSKVEMLILIFFIATMTFNSFITGGRGGQLTYFILISVLFFQFFGKRGELLKGLIVAVVFSTVTFFSAYQTSDLFEKRVDLAVKEFKEFDGSPNGSVGARLSMYVQTAKMSFDRPIAQIIIGSGVGDFPQDYSSYPSDKPIFKLVANQEGHSHPHNMLLYQLGALGLLGVASLFFVFFAAIKFTLQTNDEFTSIRWAFLIYSVATNFSDSLFLAHPTSLLFIVFSAILFFVPTAKEVKQ